jgi:hypothetical protein
MLTLRDSISITHGGWFINDIKGPFDLHSHVRTGPKFQWDDGSLPIIVRVKDNTKAVAMACKTLNKILPNFVNIHNKLGSNLKSLAA